MFIPNRGDEDHPNSQIENQGEQSVKSTCSQRAILDALKVVQKGVSGRSTQPVQNNILLEANDGSLTLTATDLEYISVRRTIPAMIEEDGACTINAAMAVQLFSALPDGQVTVATDDRGVVVSINKAKYNLSALNPAYFGKLPSPDEHTVEVDAAALETLLRKTLFCTSKDETRPILTGVLFTVKNDSILGVSTDTYRLSTLEIPILPNTLDADFRAELIVSRRMLAVVISALPSEGTVRMSFSDKCVGFSFNDTEIVSRLIEGQFVNYAKVIPDGHDKSVTCNVEALTKVVQRVLVVAKDDADRVVFSVGDGELQLHSNAADVGKAEDTVKCESVGDFDEFQIAFNGQYLLQMLGTAEGDNVTLGLSTELGSATVTDGAESYKYVLMPMQVM